MTDVKNKSRINQLIEKLKRRLGLSDWIINVFFKDDGYYSADDHDTECAIESDLKYMEADLYIFKPFWDHPLGHQEINIKHELVHLLLCPLHPCLPPIADDVLESVVQKIAMNI